LPGVPGALLVLAAACAGAAAVALPHGRGRAVATLGALLLAAVTIVALNDEQVGDLVFGHPALAAVAAAGGLVLLAAVTALLVRHPAAFALLVLAALPFRLPVSIGDETASLLLPLYLVIAAGAIAHALRRAPEAERHPRLRYVEWALAAALLLYGVQTLYSTDVAHAAKNVCFFYVPFAVLFRLLLDVQWSRRLVMQSLWLVTGLAVVFVLVGFFEYATGRLLLPNPKVIEANELKPYFRVNSLFFDPNIYGRFLALVMIALAAGLLWSRRTRDGLWLAPTLALLWGGLVLSLSQSSFAALLVGLAVLAAVRWRALPVVAATGLVAAAAAAVVFLAPGLVGVDDRSERSLDRATSGRASLTTAGVRMAQDRPVWGFGSGSFAERYRAREELRSANAAAVSHTTPLTIAAEQGAIGLLSYLALIGTAFALLFSGLRAQASAARIALAAGFAALVLHTLVYAAFLEDPLAWVLLALSAGLATMPAGEPDTETVAPPEAAGGRIAAPAPV
jgi:O-antigen ligase